MAADNGYVDSMLEYGLFSLHGEDTPIDKKVSCEYFEKAVDLGNLKVMYEYGLMLNKGEGIQMNKEESIK